MAFGVAARDPVVFVAVPLLLSAVALALVAVVVIVVAAAGGGDDTSTTAAPAAMTSSGATAAAAYDIPRPDPALTPGEPGPGALFRVVERPFQARLTDRAATANRDGLPVGAGVGLREEQRRGGFAAGRV